MPFKYEDSEDQDHWRSKRQKIQSIQHIRSTKAACLEEERQADILPRLALSYANRVAESNEFGRAFAMPVGQNSTPYFLSEIRCLALLHF